MSPRVKRPPILDAIEAGHHVVIEASAGTGKTYTLEHLVVEQLLVRGLRIEQILVVTFTEKATREMRDRVRRKIRAVLAGESPAAEDEPAWTIDAAARARLEDALAGFDRAPISTIHAFCQRVLTESAFECARSLEQSQVEPRETFGRHFRAVVREALAPGAPFAAVIEDALSRFDAATLEDALYRWHVERGVPTPGFDRERVTAALRALPSRADLAPGGMVTRLLERALSRQPKKTVPACFAGLAPIGEAIREGGDLAEALLAFWPAAAAPATKTDSRLAYLRKYLPKAAGVARELAPLVAHVETLGAQAGSPLSLLVHELLPRVATRIAEEKAARGELDFDDMLGLLHQALDAPGSEALLEELHRRYRVALVDEFQDTDRVQWEIFRRLFFEAEGTRLVVIGDPKQAIYGFRNADVHTYHQAREEILAAGGVSVHLDRSFRSAAPLLDGLDRIFREDYFTGLNQYPGPLACGVPERRALGPDGELTPLVLLHLVGRPELTTSLAQAALAERVAAEIGRLIAAGIRIEDGDGASRTLGPGDIHVLCRSKGDSDAVQSALTRARVPHAFYKREGLFQTRVAREMAAVLRAITDPGDRGLRLAAWLTSFFAVPLDRLPDARELPEDHPLVEALLELSALAEAERWSELFRRLIEGTGFTRRELFAAASERALTDAQHIAEVLLEEVERGHANLSRLSARLEAFIEGTELPAGESGNVHRLESERRAVQILTMHKSKGLEADVVFLVGGFGERSPGGLEPRVFHDADGTRRAYVGPPPPDVKAAIAREQREEAERLLYVALTRARYRAYIPYVGPPPPGAPSDAAVSYELEPDEVGTDEMELAAAAQLDLFGARRASSAAPSDEGEGSYELRRLSGPYRVVNDRLRDLVAEGALEGSRELFQRVEVAVRRATPIGAEAPPSIGRSTRLELDVAEPPFDTERFRRLIGVRPRLEITSYTRMKRARGGGRPEDELEDALVADAVDLTIPGPDELPGGAAVGVFLHDLLEHLPFELALAHPDAEAFLAEPEVGARIREGLARSGLALGEPRDGQSVEAVELRAHAAARLVHATLTTPLALPDGRRLEALAAATHHARELSFLLPIPEDAHPTLDVPPPSFLSSLSSEGLSIERGFIRGFIDLVFEHEGRFYVVDYKSDRLPRYTPDALAGHVEESYWVQARLYTIGALRALGIHGAEAFERRFGGLLYLFLRGLGSEGEGVFALRPHYMEVLRWEGDLRREDAPWGYPLPPRPWS